MDEKWGAIIKFTNLVSVMNASATLSKKRALMMQPARQFFAMSARFMHQSNSLLAVDKISKPCAYADILAANSAFFISTMSR